MDENVNGDAERIITEDEITPDVSPLNVLIVEDDEMVLQSVERLLSSVGKNCKITLAKSASEAMTAICREFRETREKIHLLLSDVHMPREEDGISFLQSVRANFSPTPFTAVMSGYPDSEQLRGISDIFISKPEEISHEKFEELLLECRKYWKKMEELQGRHSVQYGAMENDEIPDDFAPNILVVDDDQAYREWVSGAMKDLDVPESKIFTIGNSEDALAVITNSIDSKGEIELVICDLNIQRGDERIDFMKTVKEMPNAPFIVICSKHKVTKEIKELADKVISKSGNMKRHLSEVLQAFYDRDSKRDYPETTKRILSTESLAYGTSTFPPLITSGDPRCNDDLKHPKKSKMLGTLDLDDTLFRPENEDGSLSEGFHQFVDERYPHLTIKEKREEFLHCWTKWRKGEIKPEDYDSELIEKSSKALVESLKGARVIDVMRARAQYVKDAIENKSLSGPGSRFYGYTVPIVRDVLPKYNIDTVVISGSELELVQMVCSLIGVKYCFGLEVEQENGVYLGKYPYEHYTGQARGKDGICKHLVEQRGHTIVFSIGNSSSDVALISAATESRNTNDIFGAGLIVNRKLDDERRFRIFRFPDTSGGQLSFLDKDASSSNVLQTVNALLENNIFGRLAEGNPEKAARNLKKLVNHLFAYGNSAEDIRNLAINTYLFNANDVREAVARKVTLEHLTAKMQNAGLNYQAIEEGLVNGTIDFDFDRTRE